MTIGGGALRPASLAIAVLFTAVFAASASGQTQDAAGAWKELFAVENPAGAPGRIQAVLNAVGNDPAQLRKLIEADVTYKKFPAGWLKRSTQVQDGKTTYDVNFLVRIPPGYDGTKSFPLILAAHGQTSRGELIARTMLWLLGDKRDEYVIVAPTMPGPKHFNARRYQEQTYLKPLDWCRRNLNIDDDRIYLSGYSQGGHVSWHLATMFPRHFAAVVPMAGIPFFEGGLVTSTIYLENLSNLPLWAIWGEKDGATPPALGNVDSCRIATKRLKELGNKLYKGTELPGKGHGGCYPPSGEFAKFLDAHKRNTTPEKFQHRFHLAHHTRGYYLRAERLAHKPADFSKTVKIKLPLGKKPNQRDAIAAIRRYVRRSMFRFSAERKPDTNELAILAVGVRRMRLFVTDGMFDLSKPVRLRYWSRSKKLKIPVSAKCMLLHYARTRDRTNLVLNEVTLDITGQVKLRYP